MREYDEIDKIRAKNLLQEIKEFAEEEEISIMESIEIYKLLEIRDIKAYLDGPIYVKIQE